MPTAPDAEDMSAEMARRTRGLVGQSPAVTLAGLAQSVLGRPCRYVEDFQRSLLVCGSSALDAAGRAGCLGRTFPASPTPWGRFCWSCWRAADTAEEIAALLERWAGERPGESALADDLARLLVGYERAAAALGLVDRPTAVREATRAAAGWDRPVALYGFTSFTQGQRALRGGVGRLDRGLGHSHL